MMKNVETELLTAAQVADLLKIKPRTVRMWSRKNRLPPPVMIGKRAMRWRREDVLAFIRSLPRGESDTAPVAF